MGFGGMGMTEMVIIGVIALLLFGKRLPEVARGLGKGIVEFKKGMAGIEDEVRSGGSSSHDYSNGSRPSYDDDNVEMSAPKFEPPTSEPKEEATA